MSNTSSTPTFSLEDRIQALPQELQDEILEQTIAIEPDTAIILSPSYRPPLGLHLNRKIRHKFASTYYSTTAFRAQISHISQLPTLNNFLSSLPAHHMQHLTKVEYEDCTPMASDNSTMIAILPNSYAVRMIAYEKLLYWRGQLPRFVKDNIASRALRVVYADVVDGAKVKWVCRG
ncbi:hypothetical protein CLAFUW4_09319 [Fulvia fulva]|uniref:Uncharacterized protein n=1 Tax=Passalora fulva TaxID=5499 RepID=A0A9Q8PG73_PASFU|nr:uncharacterized protein CLAFUR5_09419 [Fulvia fulva]KAK4613528.1 hypothetical protein CLAFUR4_09325 [Fulvia fulva]KAK4614461.1 hypothetical protein CLAFUR0_09317 [Fulvia fulva]UJO21903.1 hypothetical protein CLAFUR5_09419 [Fulvia fulva]WPV20367.1 hypothetical protein CLAFUW4_09319 [Fulvia fulva]WPV35141.1 hypothetical protein CLAFUW7_09320 [Fulvia fulva]